MRKSFTQVPVQLVKCLSAQNFRMPFSAVAEKASVPLSGFQSGDGSIRRTYKSVDVQPNPEQSGFVILLDNKRLKTPNRSTLILPNYALALAIGAEWEWQGQRKVHPSTMPLMTLAATAIDTPKPRVFMVEEIENYIHTDPVLCRDKDPKIRKLQDEAFYPVQEWAEDFFKIRFSVSDSYKGAHQSDQAVERARQFLSSLDHWRLLCLHSMVLDSKSLLIGVALFNNQISVKKALSISRVEEEVQMEEWGKVEGGHDVDISTIYTKLLAASVFVKLLKV